VRHSLLVAALAALAGCDAQPWYKDAAAFRNDLQGWSLVNAPVTDALAKLELKGFNCARGDSLSYNCARRVEKGSCTQTQAFSLQLARDEIMVRDLVPAVLANGELPTACL
jgi:hypothetical protein